MIIAMSMNKGEEINPVVRLNEIVQQQYGDSIRTAVIGKTGEDHCPEIKVRITLPDGRECEAVGPNKREAKKIAAQHLLEKL